MFNLLSRRFFPTSICLLLMLIHLSAQAVLIRGAGEGTTKDSSATQYFLVNDSYVNSLGLDASFAALASSSLQSGRFEAGAAPVIVIENLISEVTLDLYQSLVITILY